MLECLNISILVGKSLCPEFASAHHLLAPAQELKETNNQRVNAWHIRGPRHILRVNSICVVLLEVLNISPTHFTGKETKAWRV